MDYLYLALSGILFGGIVCGGKVLSNMGATLLDVMLYPNLIALIVMLYPACHDFGKIFHQPAKMTFLFLFAMTAITFGQYAPLFLGVPVSLVVILLYLQPLWTALIERFYFHKKQSLFRWTIILAMLAGMIILINPSDTVSFSKTGIILSILGGVGLSLWVFITQNFSKQGISPAGTFFSASLYSVLPVVLLVLMLIGYPEYQLTFDWNIEFSAAFLFYGLVIFTLPNIILFHHNTRLPASVISMILLLEPVSAVVLDVIFLKTPVTFNILIGGGTILLCNVVLFLERHQPIQAILDERFDALEKGSLIGTFRKAIPFFTLCLVALVYSLLRKAM